MPGKLEYKDITEKIIGASFEVHKFLGNGFQEAIYQRALALEVKSINQRQSVIPTIYDIVRAHGGELKVNTKETEGAEFIVQLSS